jgi:hypothetical protein
MTIGTGGAEPRGRRRSRSSARPDRGLLTKGPRCDADRAELLSIDILAGAEHRSGRATTATLESACTVQAAGMRARPRPPRPGGT